MKKIIAYIVILIFVFLLLVAFPLDVLGFTKQLLYFYLAIAFALIFGWAVIYIAKD